MRLQRIHMRTTRHNGGNRDLAPNFPYANHQVCHQNLYKQQILQPTQSPSQTGQVSSDVLFVIFEELNSTQIGYNMLWDPGGRVSVLLNMDKLWSTGIVIKFHPC